MEGKKTSRAIQILGSQTLEALHEAIFQAYGRWDRDHLHEFLFWKGRRERSSLDIHMPDLRIGARTGLRDPDRTRIRSLGLFEGRTFAYRFDLGDDWLHRIDVDSV